MLKEALLTSLPRGAHNHWDGSGRRRVAYGYSQPKPAVCGLPGAVAGWHRRPGSLVCGSASTPAARSPISFRSIAARAPCGSPRWRARPPIRPSGWCAASRRSSTQPAARRTSVAGLAHGTTVATNALLQGEISGLGLIVTAGFRHILEIARQSVPEGYGNSYFWVKPERIVPLHLRARSRRAARISAGRSCGRSTRRACAPPRNSFAAGHARDRRLPDPLLRQSRARAPRR